MPNATDFVNARSPLGIADLGVKNTSGSPITSGMTLKFDTANPMGANQGAPGVTPTVAVADVPDGVAIENIPVGGYGRMQTADGTLVTCIALGAISVGATVGPSTTAGQITTYTAANPSLGKAVTAAVNAADPIQVLLRISKNA